jgi:hypothetical protein
MEMLGKAASLRKAFFAEVAGQLRRLKATARMPAAFKGELDKSAIAELTFKDRCDCVT